MSGGSSRGGGGEGETDPNYFTLEDSATRIAFICSHLQSAVACQSAVRQGSNTAISAFSTEEACRAARFSACPRIAGGTFRGWFAGGTDFGGPGFQQWYVLFWILLLYWQNRCVCMPWRRKVVTCSTGDCKTFFGTYSRTETLDSCPRFPQGVAGAAAGAGAPPEPVATGTSFIIYPLPLLVW